MTDHVIDIPYQEKAKKVQYSAYYLSWLAVSILCTTSMANVGLWFFYKQTDLGQRAKIHLQNTGMMLLYTIITHGFVTVPLSAGKTLPEAECGCFLLPSRKTCSRLFNALLWFGFIYNFYIEQSNGKMSRGMMILSWAITDFCLRESSFLNDIAYSLAKKM